MKDGAVFLDVKFTYDALKSELDEAYNRVMNSGIYIGGEEVQAFEREFAHFCGAKHCVSVGNGLDALSLALRAAGIGLGDEVIVPANTFIATWLAVTMVGAKVVPIDADPYTMGLNVERIEKSITKRTKAIMPVHLYGIVVPMDHLRAVAEQYDLLLIEDAAQAHGASFRGRQVGQLGDCAGFSFYPGKNFGAFGDGGAFVSSDAELTRSVRKLANYGSERKYFHEMKGVNSRLDPLQAAFLRVKLKHLPQWNAHRRRIADIYMANLEQCDGLSLPCVPPNTEPVWHLFVVRHHRRDAIQQELLSRGIQTALHYPVANHRSDAFSKEFEGVSFPVTEAICDTCLSLPIGPHVSLDQAEEITTIVRNTVKNSGRPQI